MRIFIFLVWTLNHFNYFSQDRTEVNIYCIPGQGSDKRIFDSLKLDSKYAIHFLEYGDPGKITLAEFAKIISKNIDTSQAFILIGTSLGGMLAVEIAEILHAEKVFLISSAKKRNELPKRYKFQNKIPLYKIFPGRVLLAGAKLLQPIVEPDRKHNKLVFKRMLRKKTPKYMKHSVRMLIQWDREINTAKIIHIHGEKDHTIPIRNIKNPSYIINLSSIILTLSKRL